TRMSIARTSSKSFADDDQTARDGMASTTSATLPVVFQHYFPPPPLCDFARLFWYWRGHEVRYSRQRILPMGTVELVINLGEGHTAGAGLSGPQSESFIIERTAEDELVGIHFDLGGAFPFFSFPLDELHGLNVTLADLWGERTTSELVCRLHEAR